MKARAADVRDISERLVSILKGSGSGELNTDEPVIVIAEDLAPSETVQLDKDKILSFVTVHGSVNSHTAILARTMSIPALVSTQELTLGEESMAKKLSWMVLRVSFILNRMSRPELLWRRKRQKKMRRRSCFWI